MGDDSAIPTGIRPDFTDLPLRPTDPPFSAWGLWGNDDELGTLNMLTPEVVREASSEIKTGKRFSLNWQLEHPKTSGFGRHLHAFEHKILVNPHLLTLDDSINFNTQKSSQWDGLRHFGYQKERLFYNGVDLDTIINHESHKLGLHKWHDIGGITGRGVLIDYWSWAVDNGKSFDAAQPVAITFDDLMSCLRWQHENSTHGLDVRPGDVLFIRSGYCKRYLELNEEDEQQIGAISPPATCGVEQDVRMLQWLWQFGIAAVAGDAPGWECFPPNPSAGFMYHEVLLAGWGCPIGEMLWLEDLAEHCKEQHRWTFFMCSVPLNIKGGVASPANIVALQ